MNEREFMEKIDGEFMEEVKTQVLEALKLFKNFKKVCSKANIYDNLEKWSDENREVFNAANAAIDFLIPAYQTLYFKAANNQLTIKELCDFSDNVSIFLEEFANANATIKNNVESLDAMTEDEQKAYKTALSETLDELAND